MTGSSRDKTGRRRRRLWRYVSPRRRRASFVVLALLVTLVYGYWHLTNDARIRREAEAYLRRVCGPRVRVTAAAFHLFGGIELEGVRVYAPGDPPDAPLLAAERIVLSHNPAALLTLGRLQPTRVVIVGATVNVVWDEAGFGSNARRWIEAVQGRAPGGRGFPGRAPPISVRDSRLRAVQVHAGLRQVHEFPLELTGGMSDEHTYVVAAEAQDQPLRFVWDMQTGSRQWSGLPELPLASRFLPADYRRFVDRYNLRGELRVEGGSADGEADERVFRVELAQFSARLPETEGGLRLENVRGPLTLGPQGVQIGAAPPQPDAPSPRPLTARLGEFGGAKLRLWGRYEGYEPDSPFTLHVRVEDVSCPPAGTTTGRLAEVLSNLRRRFRPAAGHVDAELIVRRHAGGDVAYEGAAHLRDLSVMYDAYPYHLSGLSGTLHVRPGVLETAADGLIARHGPAHIRLTGRLPVRPGEPFDLHVTAREVPFDADLKAALPQRFRDFWDALSPRGRTGVRVHLGRVAHGGPKAMDLTLDLTGHASISYRGFPYRLQNLIGPARIAGRTVRLEGLRGARGAMRCRIDGVLTGVGTDRTAVDLNLRARDLPMDRPLLDALPPAAQRALEALHPRGRAAQVDVELTKEPDGPLRHRVEARLAEARFHFDAFPYTVDGLAGTVVVLPGRVILRSLSARHGDSPLTLSGQVFLGGDAPGMDLQIGGTNVRLNAELFEALPPAVQETWRALQPAGRADIALQLRHDVPGEPPGTDYELALTARDMQVRYRDFPYTVRNLTGQVTATPRQIMLTNLRSRLGEAEVRLDGRIDRFADREEARLHVHGTNIPIDRELLAALPAALRPLTSRIQPGGAADVDLPLLHLVWRPPAAPAPAEGAAGPDAAEPAEADTDGTPSPAGRITWAVAANPSDEASPPDEGDRSDEAESSDGADSQNSPAEQDLPRIAFRDAIIDFGFGAKRVTGWVRGTGQDKGDGTGFSAEIALKQVDVGARRLTGVTGRVAKVPNAGVIKVQDICGRIHSGRFVGYAEVRLSDPVEYGLRLSVDGVNLQELCNAGVKNPAERRDVRGRLEGTLELRATGGAEPGRRAIGTLRITEGKLYRAPVLLGLLQVVYLSLPGKGAFSEGIIRYRLTDNRLILDEIHLTGRGGGGMTVVGSGTVNLKTQRLRVTFLSGPPGKLPRIESLNELLRPLLREISEIRVTGTLRHPRSRVVPLRTLKGVLQRLLNPGNQGD